MHKVNNFFYTNRYNKISSAYPRKEDQAQETSAYLPSQLTEVNANNSDTLSLPPEIVQQILSYLEFKHLLSCSISNKYLMANSGLDYLKLLLRGANIKSENINSDINLIRENFYKWLKYSPRSLARVNLMQYIFFLENPEAWSIITGIDPDDFNIRYKPHEFRAWMEKNNLWLGENEIKILPKSEVLQLDEESLLENEAYAVLKINIRKLEQHKLFSENKIVKEIKRIRQLTSKFNLKKRLTIRLLQILFGGSVVAILFIISKIPIKNYTMGSGARDSFL
jgi:hypothetical protein